MSNFKLTNNSGKLLQAVREYRDEKLEEIGQRAEDYAQRLTPVGTPESTGIAGYRGGTLRKSITHKVVDDTVYVGSNAKSPEGAPYAIYVELGTGIYATDGNGRKSPWVWVDKNGKAHYTRGMEPKHMLKKSIADHLDEYKKIIKKP